MINKANKNEIRVKRHFRVRNRVFGTSATPRLAVYRSLNGIYAQIINDEKGITLSSASTVDKELVANKVFENKNRKEQAKIVGEAIAKRALKNNIKAVVFDRG